MRELIIGTIYELVGKLRNANAAGNRVVLPYYTLELARAGACLVGLANHHLFTTTSCMWDESLTLPGAPPLGPLLNALPEGIHRPHDRLGAGRLPLAAG